MADNELYEEIIQEPRKVRWVWCVYLFLYALAIPWYWPQDYQGPLVAGFPLWVAVTLLSVAALAVFTGWVIFTYWQVREGEDG